MPKLFDRVKVNIATTGTGTVTFGQASSPAFLTPAEAGAIDGNTVRYVVVDGTDFEEGIGTILASVAQMSRDTVTRSKIDGILGAAKINLSGAAVLVFTASAADILNPANNLSDVVSAASARASLGLGSAATQAASTFLQSINNLSDVPNAATARMHLGLGAAALRGADDYVRTNAQQSLSLIARHQARANIGVAIKNYVLNGAMMVSQENGTTAGTSLSYYAVDQFYLYNATGGALSAQQVASVTPAGSPNRLRVTVTAADTSTGTSEYAFIAQPVEGHRVADLIIGTASAKAVILRFGVKAPAGTYSVSFRNGAANRAYTADYVISAGEANADVVKVVPLALDTTGTWASDNGIGLSVFWCLAVNAASSFAAAPNFWGAGNIVGSTNQFNLLGTNGNVFELFDVGLYEGTSDPDFVISDYLDELRRCQRYWCATYPVGTRPGTLTTASQLIRYVDATVSFPMIGTFPYPGGKMRVVPSVTVYNPYTGASGSARITDTGVNVTGSAFVNDYSAVPYVNNALVNAANGVACHVVANARM